MAVESVKVSERAGEMLEQMAPKIHKTSELVQEITAASNEQSGGINQVNQAMLQLNSTTEQSASSAEQLAATSEEVSGQAESLRELMSYFTLDDAATVPVSTNERAPKSRAAKKTDAPAAFRASHPREPEQDERNFERFPAAGDGVKG